MTLRKEKLLEMERGRTRLHPLENSLFKMLRTCRKTDYTINIFMENVHKYNYTVTSYILNSSLLISGQYITCYLSTGRYIWYTTQHNCFSFSPTVGVISNLAAALFYVSGAVQQSTSVGSSLSEQVEKHREASSACRC
jgi:hypothetical protein